ncbi:MAG: leucyl aminopeptidase [Sandaracinaceae bacterium]|nr:leucyl aminopeptidase [Sandaracinaceae bacterium]
MKLSLTTGALARVRADLLAVAVPTGGLDKSADLKALDKAAKGALKAAAKLEDFTGKAGESLRVHVSGVSAKQVLLIGVGDAPQKPRDARSLAFRAAQAAAKLGSVAVVLSTDDDDAIRAASEGLRGGAYRYLTYLTGDRLPKKQLEHGTLVVHRKDAAAKAALEAGEILADAIVLARDLVNAPPNDLTPTALADVAKDASTKFGLDFKQWDKKGLEKLGMNLFLAVNRGSAEEPRMVHLVYKPGGNQKTKKVAFVGKGLTFDSGGLCIKPAASMIDMKCDMAGAAVTIGIVLAAARLNLPIEVHALFGATENMTGDSAYRPGDVFKSYEGKTVEIINTDAEGRLVLADVLWHAAKLEPDYLIDHATLTGACMVALGPWTAGLFANDDELARRYLEAADSEGELYWRMPLNDELRESLRSDIADLKHTGDKHGGSITAALFLREFVGKSKWMHLDIAGPAYLERPHGTSPKGGTGFGIATGVRFLERLAAS